MVDVNTNTIISRYRAGIISRGCAYNMICDDLLKMGGPKSNRAMIRKNAAWFLASMTAPMDQLESIYNQIYGVAS